MRKLAIICVVVACGPGVRSQTGDDVGDAAPNVDTSSTLCSPGLATCNGEVSHVCADDGLGFVDTPCDPLQGMACDDGRCTGVCAPAMLGASYIGCDYYPTVIGNTVGTDFAYAVAVSNTTATD